MTRNEFLKAIGLLGISLHFPNSNFGKESNTLSNTRVIIIGAGAAGLSVAYLLKKQNIGFTILEATSEFGGRMKINTSFSDFPIALGAEWISTANIDFSLFIDNKAVTQNIETVSYLPTEEYWLKSGDKLLRSTLNTFPDKKFVHSSWYNFFETFVLPTVDKNIEYETEVKAIDSSGELINVQCKNEQYQANKVIITTPVPLLSKINFTPVLPSRKVEAINQVIYWNGFKAFFEFKNCFYPSFVDYLIQPETDGQVSLYDAAWGQKSDKNILGIFSVGKPADRYSSLSDEEFKKTILQELDEIFEGQASRSYLKHITQNWREAPFAKGAYVSDYTEPKIVSRLQETVQNQIYFAGDAFTDGSDWGNVHNAINSAKICVESLTENL